MLEKCKEDVNKVKGAGFTAGANNPFGPEALMKAMQDPECAEYFKDPNFMQMINMCMQNPQMFMMSMQQDPRIGKVFQKMTGLDMQMFGGGAGGGMAGGPMGGVRPGGPGGPGGAAPDGQEDEFEKAR